VCPRQDLTEKWRKKVRSILRPTVQYDYVTTRQLERTETNLMRFKWEVTWTHGNQHGGGKQTPITTRSRRADRADAKPRNPRNAPFANCFVLFVRADDATVVGTPNTLPHVRYRCAWGGQHGGFPVSHSEIRYAIYVSLYNYRPLVASLS